MIRLFLATALLAPALLVPRLAHAADIRVLTTGAYRAVLEELAPAIEQQTGHHLVIQNETAGVVVQKVRAGEKLDLVVVTPEGVKSLGARLGETQPLGKVGIGVAVKVGSPKPDISTEAALRAAVLASRAPAWINPAAGGSSGIYLSRLWDRWGIAAQLAPKAVLVDGGVVATAIHDGRADLAFQQMSELVGHGLAIVGSLPDSIQNYTVYVGAIPASSLNRPAAAEVLARLAGPDALDALQAHGMEAP